MQTIGTALKQYDGTAPGADTLRFWLATGVIVYHSFGMTGNVIPGVPDHAAAEFGKVILVPMFIALSGFLLAASATRTDLRRFVMNRVLRIFPALIVLTLLTAFVIGPMFTTLPLAEYFSDAAFWRYLLVAASWISFKLPGVFVNLPASEVVNPSLWSIPVELQCYAAMLGMMLTGIIHRRVWVLIGLVAVLALSLSSVVMGGQNGVHFHISRFMTQFPYFMIGVVLYLYRDQVPRHIGLFWGCASVTLLMLMDGRHSVVLPLAVTYCAIFLATSALAKPPGLPGGDYSYGIYLYGGVAQQMVLYTMPEPYSWWLNVALALPVTFTLAIASWYIVEKPALDLRKRLPRHRVVVPNPAPKSV